MQSLLWAYEQAQRENGTLIVHFVDFANAFNSMDHMALWRWLEEINIPDIDLIKDIYFFTQTRFVKQTLNLDYQQK